MDTPMKALLLFLSLFFVSPVYAQTVDDGVKAFNEGKYEKAKSIFMPLAETDHPKSLNMLGLMYDGGLGVEKDQKVACDYFEKSAELGYVSGQNNISTCYQFGEGRKIDYGKMIYWAEKAANQGDVAVQISLLRFYSDTNPKKAKEWGQIAVNSGNPMAKVLMWDLGYNYDGPKPTFTQVACVLVMNGLFDKPWTYCR